MGHSSGVSDLIRATHNQKLASPHLAGMSLAGVSRWSPPEPERGPEREERCLFWTFEKKIYASRLASNSFERERQKSAACCVSSPARPRYDTSADRRAHCGMKRSSATLVAPTSKWPRPMEEQKAPTINSGRRRREERERVVRQRERRLREGLQSPPPSSHSLSQRRLVCITTRIRPGRRHSISFCLRSAGARVQYALALALAEPRVRAVFAFSGRFQREKLCRAPSSTVARRPPLGKGGSPAGRIVFPSFPDLSPPRKTPRPSAHGESNRPGRILAEIEMRAPLIDVAFPTVGGGSSGQKVEVGLGFGTRTTLKGSSNRSSLSAINGCQLAATSSWRRKRGARRRRGGPTAR